jgi:hypothetical protein
MGRGRGARVEICAADSVVGFVSQFGRRKGEGENSTALLLGGRTLCVVPEEGGLMAQRARWFGSLGNILRLMRESGDAVSLNADNF